MEVEVHIIEKYYQAIKGCFTISNNEKYHIESRVSTSHKLRVKETFTKAGKGHRNGIDFFHAQKFEHRIVKAGVLKYFLDGNYKKILVVFDYEEGVPEEAVKFGIQVMRITDILDELMTSEFRGERDEILRTVDLVSRLQKIKGRLEGNSKRRKL